DRGGMREVCGARQDRLRGQPVLAYSVCGVGAWLAARGGRCGRWERMWRGEAGCAVMREDAR
ncbi:hypothetical protein AXXA_18497, partial [Achromobacter insuavis AXX-A]